MQTKLQNFTKLTKLEGFPRNGEAAISFWAILFSTILYISIFFFFNIHISTIINTSKFWFLISNTLILIIAADFGAFSSSSSSEQDFYDDYVKRTHARNVPYFENNHMNIAKEINPPIDIVVEKTDEHIKDVVVVEKVVPKEVNLDIISKCESRKQPILKKRAFIKVRKIQKVEKNATNFDRTYSEKGRIMAGEEETEIVFRRSKSERLTREVEESEFSTMPVEELNRRVEEFIQRFNQEIRLQAAKTRQNSNKNLIN